MSSRPGLYSVYGYDKDNDVYELIGYEYESLDIAIEAAKYLATVSPKREGSGEPFDWIEVVHEDRGVRRFVIPCV